MIIYLPSAISELFDRISILNIKQCKIIDEQKLENIAREHENLGLELKKLPELNYCQSFEVGEAYKALHATNIAIWEAIDELGQSILDSIDHSDAAKRIYLGNIERAKNKKKIDSLYGSDIKEEKSYKHG